LIWVKKLQPGIPLGVVCRKGLGSFLLKLKIADFVFEVEKGKSHTYRQAQEKIRDFDVQRLVSAHTSLRTTFFCLKIRAQRKISFKKPWNLFVFHQRKTWPRQWPESLRLLSLIRDESEELQSHFSRLADEGLEIDFYKKTRTGQLRSPPSWADPHEGWQLEPHGSSADELCERYQLSGKRWIALFPGSVWATKMWTRQGFLDLAKRLQKLSYQIVWMGGPEEKSLGESLAEGTPGSLNLCGATSLFESLLLVSKATLVVGNDSSSSHMAALMGTPVVAIFGPTILEFGYRPWARTSFVSENSERPCRPCGPHGHRKCPLGHHRCMKDLTADQVFQVVAEALRVTS
jgi:heptosyltransferase-2